MRKLIAALLLVFPAVVHAGPDRPDFDEEAPWVELQATLPPYPKEENLLPFYVSAATDNRFFVDGTSINVGADGVVRYVLVVRSATGASNVSFEGIRCATREKKVYAFGRADGTWVKARVSTWEPISYQDRNRQHHVLHQDFFCPDKLPVASSEAAVAALKGAIKP